MNDENLAPYLGSGKQDALNKGHRNLLDALKAALLASTASTLTLNLGLEPSAANPFQYVAAHQDMVNRLAEQLHGYQNSVAAANPDKKLRIVLRYASEMNDPTNSWGGNPQQFKDSFALVSGIFKQAAPAIEVAFSPAIHAHLDPADVQQYWPGEAHVDVVSCTWYVGNEVDRDAATNFFKNYFREPLANRPFGIDEFGGCTTVPPLVAGGDETGKDNDVMLQEMNHSIQDLSGAGIEFSYASIFLDGKWGTKATLWWI